MKTVLIADDEQDLLDLYRTILSRYSREIRLVTAGDGREAINLIKSEVPDLVVTDLRMPVLDGFQVLAHLMRDGPAVPVIVTSGIGSFATRERLRAFGPLTYFAKPFDAAEVCERIRLAVGAAARGRIEGVSLASFTQVLRLEEKTCCVRVRSPGRGGVLQFAAGALVGASTENIDGEDAAIEILGWENVDIRIDAADAEPAGRPICKDLAELLLLAAERKDAASAGGLRPPPSRTAAKSGGGSETILDWFPPEQQEKVERILDDLLRECADDLNEARLPEPDPPGACDDAGIRRRLALATEASSILPAGLDEAAVWSAMCQLALAHLADWCILDLFDRRGQMRRAIVRHAELGRLEWTEELRRIGPPPPGPESAIHRVARGGTPEIHSSIDRAADGGLFPGGRSSTALARLGFGSAVAVAAAARGRTLGVLTLISAQPAREFGLDDLAAARDLAHLAALSVDNIRLAAEPPARSRPEELGEVRPIAASHGDST